MMKVRKSIEERYQHYLTWYATPEDTMSFEEFSAREKAKEEEQQRIEEASKSVTSYQPFLDRVAQGEDWYPVSREMRKLHDDICKKLYQEDKKEEIALHVAAYKAARRQILPEQHKGPRTRPIIAENVYDDDDRPTTHYL